MSQILADNEIGINSLNSKQREVFNGVHTWYKDYVKYDRRNVEPICIFLSGSGGTFSFGESNIQHHINNIALSL